MKSARKFLPFLILFILLIPLVAPIIQPGFWRSDDGNWMILRLSAFHQTLRTGQFPVRFLYSLNHGYGYPVTDFLYPLPFYLGEVFHLAGFGFVDSVKTLFGLSFLAGAVFMFLLVRKWGNISAICAAVSYSYLPYRVVDVYSRGSLGEAVAFAFIPAIFYFLDNDQLVLASVFTAALITSHNVLAFLFFPVIILYVFLKRTPFLLSTFYFLLSLALSAWFWLPAIYDLQYTRASTVSVADFSRYFVSADSLFLVLPSVLILIVSLVKLTKPLNIFFLAICLVSLFFSLPISAPLWQTSPLPRLVQFPWRFLALAIFSSAFLVGQFPRKIGIIVTILVIIWTLSGLKIDRLFYSDSYYTANDDTTTVKNEYMPRWVRVDPTNRPTAVRAVYFPGLKVISDGEEIEPKYDNNGIITTPGRIVYRETPVQLLADGISIFGLMALLTLKVFPYAKVFKKN